ncbi:hypothetical protein ACTXT7_009138, partial [Hymenolepis weldensis]
RLPTNTTECTPMGIDLMVSDTADMCFDNYWIKFTPSLPSFRRRRYPTFKCVRFVTLFSQVLQFTVSRV